MQVFNTEHTLKFASNVQVLAYGMCILYKCRELGSLSSPPTMCSLAHPATPHCSTYDTAVEVSPSMCQRSSSETEHLSLLCERTDIYPTDVAGYEDSKEADCGKPMLMKVDDTKSDVPPCDDLRKGIFYFPGKRLVVAMFCAFHVFLYGQLNMNFMST